MDAPDLTRPATTRLLYHAQHYGTLQYRSTPTAITSPRPRLISCSYVAYEYLSRKRSAPGAPITEAEVKDAAAWSRTAERGR